MRHVAILIETSRAYGRGLLRGIARYNRDRGGWSTYFQPRGLGDPAPPWLADWTGDGILARIDNQRLAQAILRAKVPVVNLRGTIANLPFPFIGSDNGAIAQVAANHLLERGFRNFAFCGYRRDFHPKIDQRGDHFRKLIAKAGYTCDTLCDPSRRRRTWEQEQAWITRWLVGLPKPVGILAANDDRGLQVLDACRRSGIDVPDQVAVLGVDNDEYLCGMALPPLSSIDVHSEEAGYRAAALLDKMMAGKKPPRRLPEILPAGVITRCSTNVLATSDQELARAVQFIRDHACRPLHVADVVAHVSLSRSSLEPRFRSILKRTIHQEIRNVQLETAKTLLAETDLPIKQVAQRCGFKNVQYFTRVFSAMLNNTPASFRRDHGQRAGQDRIAAISP